MSLVDLRVCNIGNQVKIKLNVWTSHCRQVGFDKLGCSQSECMETGVVGN